MREEGLIYSNVELDPGKAYVLHVGNVKYIDTANFLKKGLSRRYGKPVETISVLPNMPPPYLTGNFVVINRPLAGQSSRNGDKYCLPMCQADIDRDVSESPYANGMIDSILKFQDDVFVNVFKSTPEMALADGERIHVIGPSSDLFERFDDKVYQREIMDELGIPVPRGYVADGFEHLVALYQENFGGDAFVSCDRGFGGNGSEKVSGLEDLHESEKLKEKKRFIITDLLDLKQSHCAIGIVANGDEVMFVSVSDQLMDGVEHMGNLYPSAMSAENAGMVEKYMEMIGRRLGRSGYRGIFGVDFMTDQEDTLYFTEINPRKVGHIPETIFAYRAENPGSITIPELEFLAVTEGALGEHHLEMPSMGWGVLCAKAEKGQRTTNHVPRERKEKEIFRNSGSIVIDHPGKNITYLRRGKIARALHVSLEESQEEILNKLQEQKSRIKVA